MNVTVKQLRCFVAVAESRSFAEAGARVHLSQPALSIAIKNLEQEVGGTLLARTTRTLALTPDGDAFYREARRLLAEWDGALEDLHNRFALRQGRVALAAMPSFAGTHLPRMLLRYRARYPQIKLTVHDVIAETVVEMVRSGRVELGISFDPGETEDIHFQPLFEDEFVAVLPAGHPLAEVQPLRWSALAMEAFILLQRPSSMRAQIEQCLAERGIRLNVAFESHQLATVGRMAAVGLGASVVPALCRQQMEEMGARCCRVVEPTIVRRVGLLTRRRYPLSAAAEALKQVFLETAAEPAAGAPTA